MDSTSASDQPMLIDLSAIVRRRLGAKARFVPSFVLGVLERLVCQDTLNKILREAYPAEGVEFARRALEILDINVDLIGRELLPAPGHRAIFVSNHPLGGLDGIALISLFGGIYGGDAIRFPVNDMLLNVRPLRNVFVPINKFGRQSRSGVSQLEEAFDSDAQLLYFPAGLVSRLGADGRVADLEWHKAFVTRAARSGRTIVPLRFEGENTRRFYRAARWRKRLGIRFNFEQILLPSELVKARGSRYRVTVLPAVEPYDLLASMTPRAAAASLRSMVYSGMDATK